MNNAILCLDIGSGTQDVLYYIPGIEVENCPKFVLPTPAIRIAQQIDVLRMQGKSIHIHGYNMGGGVTRAVRAHLSAGLAVSATPHAALTMNDDIDKVKESGVTLSDACPDGYVPVLFSDFDMDWWKRFMSAAELPMPERFAACAQDHGFHPGFSNRMGRFKLWNQLLNEHDGSPEFLIWQQPPAMLTRLADIRDAMGGGFVADSGAAAILGALFVPEIEAQSHREGITAVNIGNSHTIAFLYFRGKIYGVYEQHTGIVDSAKLQKDLEDFRCGCLSFDQVFADRGHGCMVRDFPEGTNGFKATHVIGPKRAMLGNANVSFPAPGGDMMLAGCFGLIKGLDMTGNLNQD